MKKALFAVAAIALVIWIVSWFRTPDAVATSASRPWPGGMGTLDAVDDRFPPLHANAASRKLTTLANALPKNDAVDNYVWREIARGEMTIGTPPARLGELQQRDNVRPLLQAFQYMAAGTGETACRCSRRRCSQTRSIETAGSLKSWRASPRAT